MSGVQANINTVERIKKAMRRFSTTNQPVRGDGESQVPRGGGQEKVQAGHAKLLM
jgi:hypothetical protein